MELFKKNLICALGEHFRRYAHALRFAVGLHGAQKLHPIVTYKHYQISSGALASLLLLYIVNGPKYYTPCVSLLAMVN